MFPFYCLLEKYSMIKGELASYEKCSQIMPWDFKILGTVVLYCHGSFLVIIK